MRLRHRRARTGRSGMTFPLRGTRFLLALIEVALRAVCHAVDKGLASSSFKASALPPNPRRAVLAVGGSVKRIVFAPGSKARVVLVASPTDGVRDDGPAC